MKLKEKSQMLEYYVEEGIPKIETTISQIENLRGTEITLIVTCLNIHRLPSEGIGGEQTVFYAQGQGVLMTKDGTETGTWTGQDIDHIYGQKRTDRGSVFCRTFSKGKLAFVNNMVGVFEYEANLEHGTVEGKVWDWK